MEHYLSELSRYKELAEGLSEDNPGALLKKIELLSKALVLIGDVSAECDRQYKLIHVKRDMEYAQAYIAAKTPRKENAELATAEIRYFEAEAYGAMQKYRNEFDSMTETIHMLKLKMKVNFADGTVGNRF